MKEEIFEAVEKPNIADNLAESVPGLLESVKKGEYQYGKVFIEIWTMTIKTDRYIRFVIQNENYSLMKSLWVDKDGMLWNKIPMM